MEKIYKGEIQRLMPIFQAMAEGKTIQVKEGNNWIDIDGDEDGLSIYSLKHYQSWFRIKPKPKYRPFANTEECWSEMQKHQPFGWVKASHGHFFISGIRDKDVSFGAKDNWNNYGYLFNEYTFTDGAPFGILEEE